MDSNTLKLTLSIAGLLGIVYFIRLASKSTQKVFPKKTIMYSMILLVIFGAVRSINLVGMNNPRLNFSVFQLIYLLIGVLHTYLCINRFFKEAEKGFVLGLVYTTMMTVIGAVVLLFVFQYTDAGVPENEKFAYAILMFPFPYVSWYMFEFFTSIPNPIYDAWPYPVKENEIPEIDMSRVDDTYLLKMIITPTVGNPLTKEFTFEVPVNFSFGDFFYASTSEYNSYEDKKVKIDVIDKEGNPYGWMFYIKSHNRWRKNKLIDPDLSIIQNDISQKDTIICTRVSLSTNK